MGHMTFGSSQRSNSRRGFAGLGQANMTPQQWVASCKKKYQTMASNAIRNVYRIYEDARSKLEGARSALVDLERKALAIARETEGSFAVNVSPALDEIQSGLSTIKSGIADLNRVRDSFEAALARDACRAGRKPVGGKSVTEWVAEMSAAARAATRLPSTNRIMFQLQNAQAALEQQRQEEAARQAKIEQQRAEAEARKQAELERIRQEREAEERRYQEQLRREEEERQRLAQLREAEMEQQRMLLEQQRAAEEAERQRAAEEAVARQAAELQKAKLAAEAEERRYALEQERILREEERALRKQEREAELKQLMLLQELAAQGVPVPFAPPGAAALAPQLPGYPPGAPAPGAMPGSVPAGYVPPGFAPAPGFPPGAMPGAVPFAAGPPMAPPGYTAPVPQPPGPPQQPSGFPQYQQSIVPAPPQQAAGPGMQWASFDPGAEMFGMGALQATSNPNLTGAMIDEGYVIRGPDTSGSYQILYVGGQDMNLPEKAGGDLVGTYTEDQLFQGPVVDPVTNRVIFTPPAQRPGSATQAAVASGIFATLQEAARATGQVLTERERRKAAKYGPRYMPPVAAPPPPPSSGMSPLVVIGALGIGAAALAIASKRKKKR